MSVRQYVITAFGTCQVRSTRHKFSNHYSPDVLQDIRADITGHVQVKDIGFEIILVSKHSLVFLSFHM